MEAEPYAYLIKPCRNEELKVAINTVMHKHQFFFKNKTLLKPNKTKFINLTKIIKFDIFNWNFFIDEKPFYLTKTEKKTLKYSH